MRAGAITLVLVAHTWPSRSGDAWANAFGILGVELFFVLSGFLIGGILLRMADSGRLKTWRDLVGFWRRRWYRTLPNYYLFLGLHVAWRAWVLGYPAVISTNREYFFFLQNFGQSPSYFFPETWSLAVEEWFYLLFALLLWLALHITRGRTSAWVKTTGLFLIVPCIFRVWAVVGGAMVNPDYTVQTWRQIWDDALRKSVDLRLDVVMYGVIGAFIAARRPEWWKRLSRFWWCGGLLTAVGLCSLALNWPLDRGRIVPGLLLWPVLALGFGLLLPRCSSIVSAEGRLANAVRWVAVLSYALYLCHGMVFLILKHFFGPRSFWPIPKHGWTWCLSTWVLSFGIAWVTYRWFEKPIMDMRDRRK